MCPAIANDSCLYYDSNHVLPADKIDLNHAKSRLSAQPQCGDELL